MLACVSLEQQMVTALPRLSKATKLSEYLVRNAMVMPFQTFWHHGAASRTTCRRPPRSDMHILQRMNQAHIITAQAPPAVPAPQHVALVADVASETAQFVCAELATPMLQISMFYQRPLNH